MNAIEARKYAMTRIKAGDYLLPSNDAVWLLRIYTYEEDGSAAWGDGTNVTGTFWAVARRPLPTEGTPIFEIADWSDDDWEFWAGPLPSRKAAIEEALRV